MVKIAGGKTGSVKRMKKEMDSSTSGRTWIRGLKEGEDLTVRFLQEPDEWYSYREHYDPDTHFFPCIGRNSDCPGCEHSSDKVQRTSRRFIAAALETETGQVVPLKLALDLANRLVARYERNGDTLLNRDYTLHRMGKGLDTTYDVSPEEKSDVDLSQYELPDAEAALIEQFEDAHDLDPEDDEGEEEKKAPPRKQARKVTSDKKTEVDTDDDVDTDDEVPSEPSDSPEEDEDEGYLTEEQALAMDKDELIELAERVDATIDKRWGKQKMVDAIFEAAG